MPRLLRSLLLLSLAAGCAQSIAGLDSDGGAVGSDASSIFPTGGDGGLQLLPDTGSSSARDAGSPDVGKSGGADGGGTRADTGFAPLEWGTMTPPSGLPSGAINAVWGDANFVWAAGPLGRVLRLDKRGSSGWTIFATINQSNVDVKALRGMGTHVYALDGKLAVYDGSSWKDVGFPAAFSPHVLKIVSETEIYVGGASGSPGKATLLRWDGNFANAPASVWTATDMIDVDSLGSFQGALFIGGNAAAIFKRNGGVTTQQTVTDPPLWTSSEHFYMDFNAMAQVGTHFFAGGWRNYIFERDPSGAFKAVYSPLYTDDLEAMDGYSETGFTEGYAVGRSVTKGPIVRFDGTRWDSVNFTDSYHLLDVYCVSRDEWYAVGLEKGGLNGVILAGSRP